MYKSLQRYHRVAEIAALALLFGIPAFGQAANDTSTAMATNSKVVRMEKFIVTDMQSFSDQAIPDKTPVAFTEFTKGQIVDELGSQDIPLVMNSSPSVYASADSGGAGDARVNVRGFDQRNISILINGVPTNDMENGWLYWSNWDGLGDVTSSIQLQRGMSAVTLPTPSVGGTMTITTEPAAMHRSYSLKAEAGYDNFQKFTGVLSTGLLNDKFAVTVGGVAKQGDETHSVRGTWTKGYGYYMGMFYKLNAKNRFEFFVIGAPQRHGQRTFASNIAAYDEAYARSLGYTDADIAGALKRGPVNAGLDFNPNWAPVSSSYAGLQYWNRGLHPREKSGFINERENYYHKPQINLNWYSTLSDRLKLASVAYFSGGFGGGSGALYNVNSIGQYSSSYAWAYVPYTDPTYGSAYDWDKIIAANAGTTTVRGTAKPEGLSLGILRNSVNVQSEVGVVSKLTYKYSPSLTFTTGVDWRTYEADHFQEVRDLLGGSYFMASATQASDFWADGTNTQLHLGDKVGYYYHSNVDWLGGFVQGQYDQGPVYGFAVYGYSLTDYEYTDQFHMDSAGQPIHLKSSNWTGQQVKGGLRYLLTKQFSVFGNAGWVTRAPVFTTVMDTYNSKLVANADNETFRSIEGGVRWESKDQKFNIKGDYYYTQWRNRSSVSTNATSVSYRRGIDSDNSGLELEAAYRPARWVRLKAAASVAKWNYTSDGRVETYSDNTHELLSSGTLYISGLKVGDAPQTQYAAGVTFYPAKGLSVIVQGRWYDRYWSDYDPTTRTDSTDRGQPWEIPSYSVYDLHVNYRLPLKSDRVVITAFLHVFNLFNKVYISDATDNSSYEGVSGAPSHSAQRAEVFFGSPLNINTGVRVAF